MVKTNYKVSPLSTMKEESVLILNIITEDVLKTYFLFSKHTYFIHKKDIIKSVKKSKLQKE